MSITVIARQAQGMRAGEVIAKLAEDAYFMRADNRVAPGGGGGARGGAAGPTPPPPPPPPGTTTRKPQVAAQNPVVTVLELAGTVRSSLIASLAAEAETAEAPTMGLT
jgi:hypothetical protein